MTFFGNVRLEAEPFEESQGAVSPKTVASQDELKAFYSVMERQEIVQRKLSRRKSGSARSLFSRKTVHPSLDPPPPTVTEIKPPEQEREPEKERVEVLKDQVPSMQSRSIIPDQLLELPAWYSKEDWARVPIPSQKMRYPMHNPIGPRRYINHHLLPSFRSAQLPSIFSPSFPAMAPTVHEASPDSTRMPDPSRTPSGSPLPTPTSSETRIADNGGRRSRKTSQTAHDTVDLLDVSDPWGTNWHHQSPYDIGLNASPVSPDVPESPNQTRPRVSSMTAGQRRKTMPSPLSQSTSAIHLVPESGGSRLRRKLSKRRKPVLGNLFGGRGNSVENNEPKVVSLPATPIEHSTASHPSSSTEEPPIEDNGSKRNSTLRQSMIVPPSALPQLVSVDKKVKRGSVLGRLARRFSIMRKSIQEPVNGLTGRDSDDWHHVGAKDANSDRDSRRSIQIAKQPSPEKHQTDPRRSIDPVKRIPPPSLESGAADRSSSISVEAPYSMGRLTIANPDTPSEGATTPIQHNTLLLSDMRSKPTSENQRQPNEIISGNSALPANSLVPPSDSPLSQLNICPSPALSLGVDKPQNQSPIESSQAADYQLSKLLPHPSPPPTQDSAEHLRSPTQAEEHAKSKALPVLSVGRSTHIPVELRESLPPVANTREPKKAQRPAATVQTQLPADPVDVPRAAPPVSESRTSKPASGSSQTRLVTEPAERTSESGRSRSVASPLVASAVPFPSRVELLPSIPFFDPIRLSATASMIVDSPLSAASMFVHPPTPHDSPALMPTYAPPLPPKTSLEDKRSASQDISTTKAKNESFGTGRQTETFKLVRSASGNLYPMDNTIIAAGQQWTVVESDVPHRSKVKEKLAKSKGSGSKERESKERESKEKESKERGSKERESKERQLKERESRERARAKETKERELKERESRERESKERELKDRGSGSRRERRQDRSKVDAEVEAEQRRTSRQRSGRVPEHSASASSSSGHPRTRSIEVRHRPEIQEPALGSQGEHKSSRRRDEDREGRPERSSEVVKPLVKLDISKPQPPPPPTPGPPAPPKLERRSSTSNRPTSELPSTAELNSLRARDVWEMERLWKGRSMYGVEPNGLGASDPISSPVEVHPAVEGTDDSPADDGPSHGSSHTSFMVQTPFQVPPPPSNIYHSMPSGPPPVINATGSSLPQSFYHPSAQNHTNHRSFPPSVPIPSQSGSSLSQLANPLPEPPRESQYTPSALLDSKGRRSTDYWSRSDQSTLSPFSNNIHIHSR